MCAKFELFRLILFSSVFYCCWQLLKANESWYRKYWAGCFIRALKMIHVPNFSSLGWFLFSSTVISYWLLLTGDDSWYEKKLDWNFYVHTKVDTCAKFQLSRLTFIFINCYQLLSATDSCWQLMTVDMNKIWLEFLWTH